MAEFLDNNGLSRLWDKIKTALNAKANVADLGAVATSNDYEDLDNKPTIPTNTWRPVNVGIRAAGLYPIVTESDGLPLELVFENFGTFSAGNGRATIRPASATFVPYDDTSTSFGATKVQGAIEALKTITDGKQETLVSGTNIKTINGNSLLGSGDITTPDTKPNSWHAASETDRTGTDWASTPTTENIELPNNSTKSVGTFQLTAGVWIVEVAVNFNSNANGRRVMGIAGTKDASDFGGTINMVSTRAVDGTNTVLSKTVLLYPSATTRYHVIAFQNRGGGLYVYPRYRAIKIL